MIFKYKLDCIQVTFTLHSEACVCVDICACTCVRAYVIEGEEEEGRGEGGEKKRMYMLVRAKILNILHSPQTSLGLWRSWEHLWVSSLNKG